MRRKARCWQGNWRLKPPRSLVSLPPTLEIIDPDGAPRRSTMRYPHSSYPSPINASGSSSLMSKKVKAGRLVVDDPPESPESQKDWIFRAGGAKISGKPLAVYQRRRKREGTERRVETGGGDGDGRQSKRPSLGGGVVPSRLRARSGQDEARYSEKRARNVKNADGWKKKWLELGFAGVDPFAFVGLSCKVFWPMDDDWYSGSISKYDPVTEQHEIIYKDGDVENLHLSREKIKFYISPDELQQLNLKCSLPDLSAEELIHNEILALAVSNDDGGSLVPGEIVWAKLAGYPMWPAIIVDEACACRISVLKPIKGDASVAVQFFGSYDFSRVNVKQVVTFLRGLLSSFDLKCKQRQFDRSLQEAKAYLCNQRLPSEMLQARMQSAPRDISGAESEDEWNVDAGEEHDHNDIMPFETIDVFPLNFGSLSVITLGEIVCDSEFFHNRSYIWPEGYSAARKFISISDPNVTSVYRMEVIRNPRSKDRPLFRVITDNGVLIDGATPEVCWKSVYKRIRDSCSDCSVIVEESKLQKSGSYMFGFSNPRVSQLIQDLPNSTLCAKYFGKVWDVPPGYTPVHYKRKDIDSCDICGMDEEYEDNLYLLCDKCHINVHANCYGESKSSDGDLWLCNLCRDGAPTPPPRCCLCPVTGGAVKPTTDGRWAHLTCAIWIPETCFLDIKKMEPIDGLSRISKDRWKLLCSICGVAYGACIQCSNSSCYVAYHPLCARAAGLCFETEAEGQHHLMSDDDDNSQCIRLLSFCEKHVPSCKRKSILQGESLEPRRILSNYVPQSNPTGCARCEPYSFCGRRGQKEPHAILAASRKKLFLENTPYLVSGCRQSSSGCDSANTGSLQILSFSGFAKRGILRKTSFSCSSLTEKYLHMKATYQQRLAFGKSKVHGFGVFAKIPQKMGDMIVEYSGEVVRPVIADIREHHIYNSLVGAGTYMFHIDNERVIDATRAGSIAHLINHSCEPNCHSRTVNILGEEHIIIFAKRDINQWEELSYDYRFLSKDEQLACCCGSLRCRGVVNDTEVIEQSARLLVLKSELIPWSGY